VSGLIAAVKTRLADQVEAFKRVQAAAELTRAIEQRQFLADAYVVPLQRAPGPNQILNGVSQTTLIRIGVVFQVKYANEPTGNKALDELEERIDEVGAALLGWPALSTHKPFEYAGGHLLTFLPSQVIWTEEFTTSFLLRKVS
jgi:hypothetical protein